MDINKKAPPDVEDEIQISTSPTEITFGKLEYKTQVTAIEFSDTSDRSPRNIQEVDGAAATPMETGPEYPTGIRFV
jgi:hypothetical protein